VITLSAPTAETHEDVTDPVGPMIRVGTILRAATEIEPEPPGPRSVALALARLGMVTGTPARPVLLTGDADPAIVHALRCLIASHALEYCARRDAYVLTDYGTALYGPDMRQRPFLTPR
jgi:hypothetical protein